MILHPNIRVQGRKHIYLMKGSNL